MSLGETFLALAGVLAVLAVIIGQSVSGIYNRIVTLQPGTAAAGNVRPPTVPFDFGAKPAPPKP